MKSDVCSAKKCRISKTEESDEDYAFQEAADVRFDFKSLLENVQSKIPETEQDEHFATSLSSEKLETCLVECGACLFNISDDDVGIVSVNEGESTEARTLALLDCCVHVFHALCILTWLKREGTCPQCRKDFKYIGWYSLDGRRQDVTRVTPDMIEGYEEEDEDENEEEEEEDEEDEEEEDDEEKEKEDEDEEQDIIHFRQIMKTSTKTNAKTGTSSRIETRAHTAASASGRSDSSENAGPCKKSSSCRESLSQRREKERISSSQVVSKKVRQSRSDVEETIREHLRSQIELRRRNRRATQLNPERVLKSIESSLSRLPYNADLSSLRHNVHAVVVPKIDRFTENSKEFKSHIQKKTPKYEVDFLGSTDTSN